MPATVFFYHGFRIMFPDGVLNISKDCARILVYLFRISDALFTQEDFHAALLGRIALTVAVPIIDSFLGDSDEDKNRTIAAVNSLFDETSIEVDITDLKKNHTYHISVRLVSDVFTVDDGNSVIKIINVPKFDCFTDNDDIDDFILGIIRKYVSDIANGTFKEDSHNGFHKSNKD